MCYIIGKKIVLYKFAEENMTRYKQNTENDNNVNSAPSIESEEIVIDASVFDEWVGRDDVYESLSPDRKTRTTLAALWFSSFGKVHKHMILKLPAEHITHSAICSNYESVEVAKMADSIRKYGLLEPVTVYKHKRREFRIIDGELRFRALKMIGCTHIKCLIVPCSDYIGTELAYNNSLSKLKGGVYRHILLDLANKRNKTAEPVIMCGSTSGTASTDLDGVKMPCEAEIEALDRISSDRLATDLMLIKDENFRRYCIDMADKAYDDYLYTVKKVISNEDKRYSKSSRLIIKDIKFVFNSLESVLYKLRRSDLHLKSERIESDSDYTFKVTIEKPEKNAI